MPVFHEEAAPSSNEAPRRRAVRSLLLALLVPLLLGLCVVGSSFWRPVRFQAGPNDVWLFGEGVPAVSGAWSVQQPPLMDLDSTTGMLVEYPGQAVLVSTPVSQLSFGWWEPPR
jgi:hypothetical protein